MINLIPIYTENERNKQNYTLLLDKRTNLVYKAYHKKVNQLIYWITFAVTLAIIRGIEDVYLPIRGMFSTLLLILLGVGGVAIGLYCYKKMAYEDVREIYLTETMIEDYLNNGKRTLRIEVWVTIIIFICFAVLLFLFVVSHWLVWLLFSFYVFVLFVVLLCRLPLQRFKLYKKG